MVSSLKGYLIESSLQKNPRWKGLSCTLSITNGIPTSGEAMREKKKQKTKYRLQGVTGACTPTHDTTVCVCGKQATGSM